MSRQLRRVVTPQRGCLPEPRTISQSTFSPIKTARAPLAKLLQAASTPVAMEKLEQKETSGVSDSERKALSELFVGLDDVLQVHACRGRRSDIAAVRCDVQVRTGRSLSDSRLGQILALAEGLVETRWIGAGPSAKLQLFQLAMDDGKERASTVAEQSVRRAHFEGNLRAAVKHGVLPNRELVCRPRSTDESILDVAPSQPKLVHSAATVHVPLVNTPNRRGRSRQESLLNRVRAREAAAGSAEVLARESLRQQLRICEDAMVLHGVVSQLFAGCQGNSASTSETAVVRVATSEYVAQRMDVPRAKVAVEYLASKASTWFCVEDAVYDQGERYLRRFEVNSAASTLAALKAERLSLAKELAALEAGGAVTPDAVISSTVSVSERVPWMAERDISSCRICLSESAHKRAFKKGSKFVTAVDEHPTKRRRVRSKRPAP